MLSTHSPDILNKDRMLKSHIIDTPSLEKLVFQANVAKLMKTFPGLVAAHE
ncbi:unnamed protein product [Penicillium roqueforti FM164]|uniref:Genomic scaffold, ProqFM164S01 n=1 Tax=Penicillium roqueforti (strain FM164) TaxID=1365484 RepID=W6PSW5_PENRF|nr:unnamed protein product [Penicillium roqueforti FM164]